MPCPAGMLEAADERLGVEDLTDVAVVDQVSQGQPVPVPPAALVHGDDAIVFRRGGDDRVGVGAAQAHRLLDHDVLAGAQQGQGEFGVQDRRRGDDRDVDRRIVPEGLGGVVGDEIGEVGTGRHEPVGHRVGGGDEREPVGLGGSEAVQVPHGAERSVADDADAEVGGSDGVGRCEQASDEGRQGGMSAQRLEVGNTRRDDPAGAEPADGDRRVVGEAHAGGRCDLDAAVDRGQGAQRGGDRDLAVEPAGGGAVGERDEPLGRRQLGADRDARDRRGDRVAWLDREQHAAAGFGKALQVGSAVVVERSGDEDGVVPGVGNHPDDPTQRYGGVPDSARNP